MKRSSSRYELLSALQSAATLGKKSIANEEAFRITLDVLWEQIPLEVQIIGRERFNRVMMGVRDKVFLFEGDTARVHPDAKEKIATTLKSILDRKAHAPRLYDTTESGMQQK